MVAGFTRPTRYGTAVDRGCQLAGFVLPPPPLGPLPTADSTSLAPDTGALIALKLRFGVVDDDVRDRDGGVGPAMPRLRAQRGARLLRCRPGRGAERRGRRRSAAAPFTVPHRTRYHLRVRTESLGSGLRRMPPRFLSVVAMRRAHRLRDGARKRREKTLQGIDAATAVRREREIARAMWLGSEAVVASGGDGRGGAGAEPEPVAAALAAPAKGVISMVHTVVAATNRRNPTPRVISPPPPGHRSVSPTSPVPGV